MKTSKILSAATACVLATGPGCSRVQEDQFAGIPLGDLFEGKRLFEQETFGGNGPNLFNLP
jgi:hypothetical protein